jgi:hypothetical protein
MAKPFETAGLKKRYYAKETDFLAQKICVTRNSLRQH